MASERSDGVLLGRSVSRGFGVGSAICLYGDKRQYLKHRISASDSESELGRFAHARQLAAEQLKEIAGQTGAGDGQTGIFETHLLFLEDTSLIRRIESGIVEQLMNAEWAVDSVIEAYAAKYRALTNRHLREKYVDLEDVGERLISTLGGGVKRNVRITDDSVIIASTLNPSTLMEIAAHHPAGIVTEHGGWTSHTFILARELGIPAVTGVYGVLRKVGNGERVAVDGYRGEVVIEPSAGVLAKVEGPDTKEKQRRVEHDLSMPVVETSDGIGIRLRINLDLSRPESELTAIGEYGVGLYRSEYLFQRHSGYPSEEEQYKRYREITELAGKSRVRIRTFDISISEATGRRNVEKNPALGVRGIRLSMRNPGQFRSQVRALLRAADGHPVDAVIPMVADITELRYADEIIAEEKACLERESVPFGEIGVGAMIEVPSAVFIASELLDLGNFVSVGTNDLVQYMLAADRDNDAVAENFRSLHPSVLRALRLVLEAGKRRQKTVSICGEMAGSALYVPLLIGLGARELSMNLGSIKRISEVIPLVSFKEAEEISRTVAELPTAIEIEEVLRREYSLRWPDILKLNL